MIARTLVLDAPPEVAARLAGDTGVVLGGDGTDEAFASVVRLCPPPASPFHRQQLAGEVRLVAVAHAPVRHNAVILGDPAATAALTRYLGQAHAVTGQVLAAAPQPLDAEARS